MYPVNSLCHTRLDSAPCQLRVRIHSPLVWWGKCRYGVTNLELHWMIKTLEGFGRGNEFFIWRHLGHSVLDILPTGPYIFFRSAGLALYWHRPLDRPFLLWLKNFLSLASSNVHYLRIFIPAFPQSKCFISPAFPSYKRSNAAFCLRLLPWEEGSLPPPNIWLWLISAFF